MRGRPPLLFCKRGHRLDATNAVMRRAPDGTLRRYDCRGCQRERKRESRQARRPMQLELPLMMPAEPIRAALEEVTISNNELARYYAARFGMSTRHAQRERRAIREDAMVSLNVADRWCVVLGSHLDIVYGGAA